MEKDIMSAAAQVAQAEAHAAPDPQDARARRPYGPPSLEAVGLGPVFADDGYVYLSDEADNTNEDVTGDKLFGSGSGDD